MALRVANKVEPLLKIVHVAGDINPLGSAKASARVLNPPINVQFCLINLRAFRLKSIAGNSRCRPSEVAPVKHTS